MEPKTYCLIENEESVTSVDGDETIKALYDGESVNIQIRKNGKGNQNNRRAAPFNIELLKTAFSSLGQTQSRDSEQQTIQEIDLTFCDLSYSVKQGIRRETKFILNNLYGEFRAGELTAIMGPSGAGKSSLMDVMAGFTTLGVAGEIKTNGIDRDLRSFARQSCYIMQDDELCPLLTVQEALIMAAHLKLGPKDKRKHQRVKKIMESLGLYVSRKVMTGKLSGGQRKRLAIALELVSNPPVMFFDEPTSGLDSSTSKQCISLLKGLAQIGRTIICTIHQPSATLFEMFDHIYAMRDGNCIYSGSTKGLVPFLAEQGFHCPHYHNPADFLLEVASMVEYSSQVARLTAGIDHGRNTDWRKNLTVNGSCRSLPEEKNTSLHQIISNFKMEKMPQDGKTKPKIHQSKYYTYPTSFWKQFSVLIVRNFRKIRRDLFFTHLQLLVHIAFGLLIGILFYDIGNDAAFAADNFSLLFFCIMLNMFTSYSSGISFYPQELPILVREHFNKWYSLKAYYLANTFSGLPVKITCTVLYTTIVYFMTAQPMELDRFVKCTSIILLVDFVAQGFGYLIGSLMNVQNSSIFGPLLTAPFILFSGYFVLVTDAPYSLKWLFHMSYFKYALEGLMVAIFGNNRSKMTCSEDYCHFLVPEKFLQQVGMEDVDYWFDFGMLFAIGFALRIVTYYTLRFRIQYFKK